MSHRLSDEVIERFRADAEVGIADEGHGTEATDREVLAMITEIQERRAAEARAGLSLTALMGREVAALERIASALEIIAERGLR